MASRKNIWDSLDKMEGKKDSSYRSLQGELKRQGYNKNHLGSSKGPALKKRTK